MSSIHIIVIPCHQCKTHTNIIDLVILCHFQHLNHNACILLIVENTEIYIWFQYPRLQACIEHHIYCRT